MKELILFKKRNKLLVGPDSGENHESFAMVFLAELLHLGYALNKETFEALSHSTEGHILDLYNLLVPVLRKERGADRKYVAFYKNFPQEVIEKSDFELWFNAMLHYWSRGLWEPADKLVDRGFVIEKASFTDISLGTEEDVSSVFTSLMEAKGSLSQHDKDIIQWFFAGYPELKMPEVIPFKENLCLAANLGLSRGIKVPVKTATDVLRIAVSMSGGDISILKAPKPPKLSQKNGWRAQMYYNMAIARREGFKFKKFNRLTRRYLLELLENCGALEEDMWRYRGRWIKLGEALHPGEYKDRYPKTYSAFQRIRNERVITFGSKVETARTGNNLTEMLKLLGERPGEFARRLDDILRDYPVAKETTLSAFQLSAKDISVPVLIQLYDHFKKRASGDITPRTVMIRGKSSRMFVIEKTRPDISEEVAQAVYGTIEAAMKEKFASREPLGKTWIAPELWKVPIPFAMRSVNTGIKTLVRGTRLPFGDFKILRAYIHWFDRQGNQDIDLSTEILDGTFGRMDVVSYWEIVNHRFGIYHSGDVRHRRGACAEYIDVDIKKAVDAGARHLLITANNYQGGPFTDLEQCVFGWMGRDFPENNLHFIPNTVQNAIALTNEQPMVYVVAVDLLNREIVWLDVETFGINLNTAGHTTKNVGDFLSSLDMKMSVGELLLLHTEARGTLVDKEEEADTKFGPELLYQYDQILSKFL